MLSLLFPTPPFLVSRFRGNDGVIELDSRLRGNDGVVALDTDPVSSPDFFGMATESLIRGMLASVWYIFYLFLALMTAMAL